MLNEFRTKELIWDKASKRIYDTLEVNSGDSNGRKLVVQVLDGGVIADLTGTQLYLSWKTNDYEHKGLDAFKAVNLSEGIFEISYTTEMLSNVGKLRASLVLIDEVGRVESNLFTITVIQSNVDDDSVQSEDSFTALTEALVTVNKYDSRIANVESGKADKSLVETEIERLDLKDESITAQLAQKANGDLYRDQTHLGQNKINTIMGHPENAIAPDVNQAIISGGGGNNGQNNVIGGNIANVGTNNSNAEPLQEGTGAFLARILGGYDNVNNALSSSINADHSYIDKGATHSTINGGANHKIEENAEFNSIGGGANNTISKSYGSIAGGSYNKLDGRSGAIGGGNNNSISGELNTVSGGGGNQTQGPYSTVGGGYQNKATGHSSNVSGGNGNVASGAFSSVASGQTNKATGAYSSVLGGNQNEAVGLNSTVVGSKGKANNRGEYVHSVESFNVVGDAQTSKIILQITTTDAVEKTMGIANTATSPGLPENSTYGFELSVVARTSTESAMFKIEGLAQRIGNGLVSFVGTPSVTTIGKTGSLNCSAKIIVSGYSIQAKVTGESGKNIKWLGNLEIVSIIG